jgi:nicotinate-nucleotide adenylyltransferase
MKLTGLLGGSFNPAHHGHRQISLAALRMLGLDEVWWLVSPGNPLKPHKGMAPIRARAASGQAAARRAPIRVTAIERELGTRYTIDTLRALIRRYPRRRFVWLMGADNLAQFHRWRDWRAIARAVPIAVLARPGYEAEAFTSPAMSWLRQHRVSPAALSEGHPPLLVWMRYDPDPVSSTGLRRANPGWAASYAGVRPRDGVTGHTIL